MSTRSFALHRDHTPPIHLSALWHLAEVLLEIGYSQRCVGAHRHAELILGFAVVDAAVGLVSFAERGREYEQARVVYERVFDALGCAELSPVFEPAYSGLRLTARSALERHWIAYIHRDAVGVLVDLGWRAGSGCEQAATVQC